MRAENGKTRLKNIVFQLTWQAEQGAPWAIQMVADRLDGKATEHREVSLNVSLTSLLANIRSREDADIEAEVTDVELIEEASDSGPSDAA